MSYHQTLKTGFGAISTPEITAKNSHVYQKPPPFSSRRSWWGKDFSKDCPA